LLRIVQKSAPILIGHLDFDTPALTQMSAGTALGIEVIAAGLPSHQFAVFGHLDTLQI